MTDPGNADIQLWNIEYYKSQKLLTTVSPRQALKTPYWNLSPVPVFGGWK